MYKIIPLLLFILTSQISHADISHGDISLPTYVALERQIAKDLQELNDPEEIKEYLDMLRWIHKARMTLFHLVEGRIELFRDAALSLPENVPDINDPYIGGQVAELLHYAVEADITISDARLIEFFGSAIQALKSNDVLSDEQHALFEASYFFLLGDAEKLLQSAELASRPSSEDGFFVCGYTNMLAGRLTSDTDVLTRSVSCLEEISIEVEQTQIYGSNPALGAAFRNTLAQGERSLAIGRASLHRASALRLLSEGEGTYDMRRRYINDAAIAATHARRNIELIDSPLMWGAAYRVTSEVLDALYSIESVETSGRVISEIAQRRDRAFQLSIAYR